MPTRKTLVRSRAAAFARQGGICHYCELPIWLDDFESFRVRYQLSPTDAERRRCTAEHLQAQQDGGVDTPDNIVASCYACNARRHRMKPAPSAARYRAIVRKCMAAGSWHRARIVQAFARVSVYLPSTYRTDGQSN